MVGPRRSRIVGASTVLAGAVLCLVACFAPWFGLQLSYSFSGTTLKESTYFLPGLPSQSGTVQYSCSNLPSCPPSTSYSSLGLNHTAAIAEVDLALVVVGFVLGLVAGAAGLVVSRNDARKGGWRPSIAVLAAALAIAAPGVYALELPGAIASDSKDHSGNGPWSSFVGSGNATAFGAPGGSASWGPGIGWYLCFGAFGLLLAGAHLLDRGRRELPAPSRSS